MLLSEQDEVVSSYGRRVGERLRAVRRRQRLSLHGVEDASNQEFRASVLGAYERGERAISVSRLQRLARLYNVPVDQLLPREASDGTAWQRREGTATGPGGRGKLTIDLVRLAREELPEKPVLGPYIHALQVQRQDFNGRVITLRDDDVRLLAGMLSVTVDQFRQYLEERGVAC